MDDDYQIERILRVPRESLNEIDRWRLDAYEREERRKQAKRDLTFSEVRFYVDRAIEGVRGETAAQLDELHDALCEGAGEAIGMERADTRKAIADAIGKLIESDVAQLQNEVGTLRSELEATRNAIDNLANEVSRLRSDIESGVYRSASGRTVIELPKRTIYGD